MEQHNTWQGIKVIGCLVIVAIGITFVWFQIELKHVRNESKFRHTEISSTKAQVTKQITDENVKANESHVQHAKLGTVGKIDDPKFTTILNMVEEQHYQGSVLLIKHGQPIWQQAFGEMSPGVPFEPDTPISLTSISKNVTAYLLMKELTRRQMTLDTKLSYFYPKMLGAEETTLRDLIRMDAPYHGIGYVYGDRSEQEFMNMYLTGITYKPTNDKKWHYNAADYQILTNVLYKLTKTPYNKLVERELKPKYNVLTVDEFEALENRPTAYAKNGDVKQFNPQRFHREVGTGSLFMSAWDAYRYISDEIKGQNLTKQEFSELTKLRTEGGYGYSGGMYVQDYGYLLHGILQGYEPSMMLDKTGENGVVLFSNHVTGKIDEDLAAPIFTEIMAME